MGLLSGGEQGDSKGNQQPHERPALLGRLLGQRWVEGVVSARTEGWGMSWKTVLVGSGPWERTEKADARDILDRDLTGLSDNWF